MKASIILVLQMKYLYALNVYWNLGKIQTKYE